jgi:hypothetical protein
VFNYATMICLALKPVKTSLADIGSWVGGGERDPRGTAEAATGSLSGASNAM